MREVSHRTTGSGEPVLLLHAFGLSGRIWAPVEAELAADFQVLTVDLPGHGDSELPADPASLNPAGYAAAIALLLDELGIDRIHVAGNSIGGWTALELALLGRAESVTALSPAGLWPRTESLVRRARFRAEHRAARAVLPVLHRIARTAAGRRALLGEAMVSASSLPPAVAAAVITDYASVRDMRAHLRARKGHRFTGGHRLAVPITVAWGANDRIIGPGARNTDQLPAHTRWTELPGCGHVMIYDNPGLTAATIRSSIEQALR